MSAIGGFSSSDWFQFWRGETGIFSAAEGKGFIFVPDHGKRELDVVNLTVGGVVGTANLAGPPDYVRYVEATSEVWVTEPRNNQIEVFTFSALGLPMLRLSYVIPVSDGPESLVIDHANNRAYTNLGRETVAIDIAAHAIVSRWSNECQKSRGDAVDEQKGFLFVSCAEGKVSTFDINHGNKKVGSLAIDPGPDVISFNAKRSHLYVTSSENATLSVLWVSAQGELSLLAQAPTDKKAHCVVGDDQDNIWVCDPLLGQLLRFKDLL
jgi:DNA-binding beta-propeller fold protein YncE